MSDKSNKDGQSLQNLPAAEGEVLSEEDVKKLPKEMQRKIITMVQSYSGPIPPASEIAKYEKVQKGSAKRIIGMAETALDAEIKDRWWHNVTVFWGMLSNKLLLVILLGLSVYLLMNGKEIAALLAGALPLLQLFTNIDFGHRNQPKSAEQQPAKTEKQKATTKKKPQTRKKKTRKK